MTDTRKEKIAKIAKIGKECSGRREMTEEQREAGRKRMKQMHKDGKFDKE